MKGELNAAFNREGKYWFKVKSHNHNHNRRVLIRHCAAATPRRCVIHDFSSFWWNKLRRWIPFNFPFNLIIELKMKSREFGRNAATTLSDSLSTKSLKLYIFFVITHILHIRSGQKYFCIVYTKENIFYLFIICMCRFDWWLVAMLWVVPWFHSCRNFEIFD